MSQEFPGDFWNSKLCFDRCNELQNLAKEILSVLLAVNINASSGGSRRFAFLYSNEFLFLLAFLCNSFLCNCHIHYCNTLLDDYIKRDSLQNFFNLSFLLLIYGFASNHPSVSLTSTKLTISWPHPLKITSGPVMSLSQEPQTDASSAVAQIGYRPRDPSILIGKKWSEEEDQKLWNLIVTKSIKSIDEEFLRELPGRSGSACRVRYYQLLRQVTLYAYDACGTWSDKDDQLLAEMHRQKEDYAQIANDHPRATTAMDCWIRLFRLLKDQIKR